MGAGAGPGREVAAGREPGDGPDLDQQTGRAGRADPVEVEQPSASDLDELDEFLVYHLVALVDPLEVGDQLHGVVPLAGLADHLSGTDTSHQPASLGGGQVPLRPTWDQFEQQLV